jgi:hypothetical protein
MDERKRKILVVLVFFIAVRHVMTVVVILQKNALHEHDHAAMTMVFATMVAEMVQLILSLFLTLHHLQISMF